MNVVYFLHYDIEGKSALKQGAASALNSFILI